MAKRARFGTEQSKGVALAAAAVALAGAAALSIAQSPEVFVPELAAIEGGLCLLPSSGRPSVLKLAQAATPTAGSRKTEVSPATPAAARASASVATDDDPPLLSGLGRATLPITTSSREAQQFFDQGYRLAWGFNHAEALRAFRKAQRLDPQCAMCFWAEAWALGPNINVPMDPAANAPARDALRRAEQLAPQTSTREQALIGALARRYAADASADRTPLDAAYAAAMREVAARHPTDAEVELLYADALMNASPWDYWEPGGAQPRAAVADLVPTLERILARDPEHAAAIHLYIHAVEASADPKRAEPYADRLAKLAPRAGHLVHMPSHIYFVVGRYADSLATNVKAVAADEAYIAAEKPVGVYPLGYYAHNVHFVMVSAQMGGDAKKVVAAAQKLGGLIPDEPARDVLMLQPMKAAPYFAHAQFSPLATVMALPDPGPAIPYVRTAWHYARGSALALAGDAARAQAELDAIERIVATTDYAPFAAWKIPAREVAQIAAHVLRARIAQSAGDLDAAVAELQQAIRLQDELPYMEPAYWYYPVRQSLGALLLLEGDTGAAREAFGAALVKTPNNAWALYGLGQAYARDGKRAEARAVEARFRRAWMGGSEPIRLARM
jgi:tetratricopeptide (TPR) repeat protein